MIIKLGKFEVLRFSELNSVANSEFQTIMSQFTVLGLFGFHLRIHRFYLGDDDWFHTHPRAFASLCIQGSYQEQILDSCGCKHDRIVSPGTVTFRCARTAHNVQPLRLPCRTIAITTPVINKWRKFQCE